MSKRWIWEFDNYPNFTYDKEELNSLIEDIVFLQGSLSSIVSFASKETLEEKLKDSYADEVINSSDIEGEFLNRNSVQWLSEEKLPLCLDFFNVVRYVCLVQSLGYGRCYTGESITARTTLSFNYIRSSFAR